MPYSEAEVIHEHPSLDDDVTRLMCRCQTLRKYLQRAAGHIEMTLAHESRKLTPVATNVRCDSLTAWVVSVLMNIQLRCYYYVVALYSQVF